MTALKVRRIEEAKRLCDIPNIGPSMADDLKSLGIVHPRDLASQDAFALYKRLCKQTRSRQDPCVLDTFLAAVDFAKGAPARPWWDYTATRKRDFPDV